jgi:hypothetical protein
MEPDVFGPTPFDWLFTVLVFGPMALILVGGPTFLAVSITRRRRKNRD